jgi:hypothetical protein
MKTKKPIANPLVVDKLLTSHLMDVMPMVTNGMISSHGCSSVDGFKGDVREFITTYGREDLKFFLNGARVSEFVLSEWLEFVAAMAELELKTYCAEANQTKFRQDVAMAWGLFHQKVGFWTVPQLQGLRAIIEHILSYYVPPVKN